MTATLETGDAQLARAGAPLLAGRMRLVAALRPHVAAAYEAVSGGQPGHPTGMNYRSSALDTEYGFEDASAPETAPLEKALLAALGGVPASELDPCSCLVGPPPDELELT